MLEVRLLGQFSVQLEGQPLELPSRPAQSLLAYLILNAGMTQRRGELADLLWPGTKMATARNNLRHVLGQVRKVLGICWQTRRDYLSSDDLTITFDDAADYWLDVAVLERVSITGEPAEALIEAVSVYQGELLPGFDDRWIVWERERLQAIFEDKMVLLLEQLEEVRRWLDVLKWAEHWIAVEHIPERAYQALMIAHHGLGNLSRVAEVFERCEEACQEAGSEPSIQTRVLYQHLVGGE